MNIQLQENLEFINIHDVSDRFKLIKWHFYCQDEEIWCARFEDAIYPLNEITLEDYRPIINGQIINEDYDLYE